jgi:site-specific recombinase XerD
VATKSSSSHVSASNYQSECVSDEDLIRGWKLDLSARGLAKGTLSIYSDSVQRLSKFAKGMDFPPLAEMGRQHVRHFLASLHQAGNKPASVHARYRALKTFFKWTIGEEERESNPLDFIDPPRLPNTLQPHYPAEQVEAVLKAIGRGTVYQFRDTAIVRLLYDSGMRAAELCGIKADDIQWSDGAIKVIGKAGKERRVSVGSITLQAIERYLRRRTDKKSIWLFLATGSTPLTTNGLRMMLVRRFESAGIPYHGAHGFRRAFAMAFLEAGGHESDLKELAGWSSYSMLSRYTQATAGERAVKAAKKFSPGDRLKG